MKKYVPISKQSKKAQKEYHAKQRQTWNGLNPVSRIEPNGKGYDRNKIKRDDRRQGISTNSSWNRCLVLCCALV